MSKKKTTKKAANKKATKKAVTSKKAPIKKTAATKKPAAKKAVKKTAAKKAVSKPANKAAKKAVKKAPKAKSTKTEKVKKDAPSPETASEILNKRTRKSTPAIFKIKSRKNTPILFTLEDVQHILDKKKAESVEQENTKPKEVKQTKKKIDDVALPAKKSVHGAASITDILGFNPTKNKEQKISDIEDSQVPSKWKKYYKELKAMREQLINGLELHTKETLHRSNKDDSGNLSNYSQHMADAGTDNFDRDFALSLVSSEQEALQEIDAAIRRITDGNYGVCEITGEAIKKERLMAVPFTRYSLEGQRQLERNKTRKSDRSTTFADFGSDESISFSDDDE